MSACVLCLCSYIKFWLKNEEDHETREEKKGLFSDFRLCELSFSFDFERPLRLRADENMVMD